MRCERIRWQAWDAVRCVAGGCELVVGFSAGPRILSLRVEGGTNLLYADTTGFGVGEWRLYGGHRFTVGPESAASYLPDNAPCAVEISEGRLRVTAPGGADGLRRELDLTPAGDGAGFDVVHRLHHQGDVPWSGVLWGITCVPNTGHIVAPVGLEALRYWPGVGPADWRLDSGHLVLRRGCSRGKVGWYGDPAWLALRQPDAILVIHCPESPGPSCCEDSGCNVEVFVCAQYSELETLSGKVHLTRGETATHLQRWRVLDPSLIPGDWRSVGLQAGCMSTPTTP